MRRLLRPLDDVKAARAFDDVGNRVDLHCEARIGEGSGHRVAFEVPDASFGGFGERIVRVFLDQLGELALVRL